MRTLLHLIRCPSGNSPDQRRSACAYPRECDLSIRTKPIAMPDRLDAVHSRAILEIRKNTGDGMKILVVDDEQPIVEAVAYNLKKEGFTVLTAADAEQCLEITRREEPSLVILDVMLPSASGFDVCRLLRKQGDIPIIMVTARADETDRIVGLELGADD